MFDPASLRGARQADFPGFIEPCLATKHDEIPRGTRWLHEIKFDGYRTQLQVRAGEVYLFTRRGYDWTARFDAIALAARRLPVRAAILDGEVIVPGEKGIADFAALQTELANGRSDRMVYCAFDLLYLDGFDLRGATLTDRKAALAAILEAGRSGKLLLSQHLEGDADTIFRNACRMRLEGIVSKLRNARYESGRSDQWRKVSCVNRDAFKIVGFVAAPHSLTALYLGRRDGPDLVYAGKAATGFTDAVARELRKRLDALKRVRQPLTRPVKKPKATWVEPLLEAEIEYRALTPDGRLRHPSFKGLREDMAAPEPEPPKPGRRERWGNVQRLLHGAAVPSPARLADYWRRVSKPALQYLGRRPLTLVRHVNGRTFFHTGALPPVPAAVHAMQFEKR